MIQALGITVSGMVLFWFGYALFFGPASPLFQSKPRQYRGRPGEPHVCPVCSIKMTGREQLKFMVFPATTNKGQLMLIRGCLNCLKDRFPRRCPVCGGRLNISDYLISRMTGNVPTRHAHVIGCNHCNRTGSLTKRHSA